MCSENTVAPFDNETLEALHDRHPPSPTDLSMPPPPDMSVESLTVTAATIEKCIRSFKPGSAAGPDKLSPQHLKELLSRQTGEAGSRLLQALTTMANVLLSGAIPPQVQPILFGANLIALRKPLGGVRPIAIGNTLRRMVAKAVNCLMFDTFGEKLRPIQLGCGTKAGCEAAVHASRTFLANASEDTPRVLLKLDFQNAFNSLRRDRLLTVVKEDFPHLYPFIWQAYSAPSTLFFGCHSLSSATGVQQGDPLGPALFSLAIHSLITSLTSDLNLWYLDDGTIGGSVSQVFSDFETIRRLSPTLGLHLNIDKCELVTVGLDSSATLLHFQETAPSIRYVAYNNAMLLGAPLSVAATVYLIIPNPKIVVGL